jgi:hypothetical protein
MMKKFNEYMLHKRASGIAGEATEGIFQGIAGLIPYVVVAPLAAGSAVGYLASRISSPSDSDVEALQKRVMDTEVREKLALSKRRLEALKRKMAAKAGTNDAAETRRRDMFL